MFTESVTMQFPQLPKDTSAFSSCSSRFCNSRPKIEPIDEIKAHFRARSSFKFAVRAPRKGTTSPHPSPPPQLPRPLFLTGSRSFREGCSLALPLRLPPSLSSIPSFLKALDLDTINNEVDGLGNSLPPSPFPSLPLSSSLCEKQLSEAFLCPPLSRFDGECVRVCGVWSRAMGPWARRVGGRRRQGRREAPLSAAASAKVALRGGTRGTSGEAGENPLRNALCARASQRSLARALKPPTIRPPHRNHPRPLRTVRREGGRRDSIE